MKTGNSQSFTSIVIALAITVISAIGHAETSEEWAIRALYIQSSIDNGVPLARTTWIGTHNSYANPNDDFMRDYNQPDSLTRQMNTGVRNLGIDVHYDDGVRMCHNNLYNANIGECVNGETGDRAFWRGLNDIKDWLVNHNDQVVLLKLELSPSAIDQINSVYERIHSYLGSTLVYRTDRTEIINSHGDLGGYGCTKLPVTTLTKQSVLTGGANIIIYTDNSCLNAGGFNNYVFYSGDSIDNVNDPWDLPHHGSPDVNTKMFRARDDATRDRELSPSDNVKMQPSNVRDWLTSGLNIFELYGFNASSNEWNIDGESPVQAEHMVWSWAFGEPANSNTEEDCAIAVYDSKDAHLADVSCSRIRRYVCYSSSKGWLVTDASGVWAGGSQACKNESAGTYFRVPISAYEMIELWLSLYFIYPGSQYASTQTGQVWVNYNDQAIEGKWVANQ